MTEINGFKIDKFNIHNLPEGKKLSTCPLCSEHRKPLNQKKKCLMLDWDTGIGTCQHCSEVIQLHTFKKKEQTKVYKKPVWKNKTDLSDSLVKWFEGRKIEQSALNKLKVTEGKEWMPQTQKEENAIQFNYFRDYELINVKYRDGRKNFKMFKDAEKIPYNLDNIRTNKECVIVEGEIDVLSIVQAGYLNVVSSPNGSTIGNVNLDWLDNSIDYFDNKEKIILALDDDEPGQNVQKELVRRLGAERCYLVALSPFKDFNEVLCKEGRGSVIDRINEAKPCPLENIVTLNDTKAELHDFYLNGAKKGFQIGLKKFDDIFSTLTKQYVMITGVPSSGKSDFVDQMCIGYNLKYGWKTAYCSVENKPEYLHVDKICRKLEGERPTTIQGIESDKWRRVEDHVNDNFYFINFDKQYELDAVLAKAAELVKRKGIKCLVLDPFNKIRLKSSDRSNTNQYTEDYHLKLDAFCAKYDVFLILVAHPVKMKKVDGITPKPDFYDIKGGGEHYDMSYHGLCVHRNYNNNSVEVSVLKIKFQHLGDNKGSAHFMWNPKNGRYSDYRGDAEDSECVLTPIWNDESLLNTEPIQNTLAQQMEQAINENTQIKDFQEEFPAAKDMPF